MRATQAGTRPAFRGGEELLSNNRRIRVLSRLRSRSMGWDVHGADRHAIASVGGRAGRCSVVSEQAQLTGLPDGIRPRPGAVGPSVRILPMARKSAGRVPSDSVFEEKSISPLQRKLIFYIPFGVGLIGDPEGRLDHMKQPQQQRLPVQPLQQDHATAPGGIARTV